MSRIVALSPSLKKKYAEHIGDDVTYPASCNDLVAACNNMSEFSKSEKEWFSKSLPHGSFESADEVRKVLHL
jgi:hypothetical protein